MIFHTADWHLGQTLHGHDRGPEHDAFLRWFLDAIREAQPDGVLLAGDVFDVASPSAASTHRYFRFLAEVARASPQTTVVVIAGNHDSPHRLEASKELLDQLRVRVVGRADDLERMLVPLGPIDAPKAWVLAIPYLRPADLSAWSEASDPEQRVIEGYRRLHDALLDRLAARRAGRPVIAMGHCYMAGGTTSEESERPIQRGYQSAFPSDVVPAELSYVALGHLHRAQAVPGETAIRYSGSPIPLSMTEKDYLHQMVAIRLGERTEVETRAIPRSVPFLVVPLEAKPLDQVLAELRALPRFEAPPFLEVRVQLEAAEPRLRRRVEEALAHTSVRLTRIVVQRPQGVEPDWSPAPLRQLAPRDVFEQLVQRTRGTLPSPELSKLFDEVASQASEESS
ncbi:MAG: exonuclease SbcCD subunit D C-terminal domain-containing protein [Myxococcota bacterium]